MKKLFFGLICITASALNGMHPSTPLADPFTSGCQPDSPRPSQRQAELADWSDHDSNSGQWSDSEMGFNPAHPDYFPEADATPGPSTPPHPPYLPGPIEGLSGSFQAPPPPSYHPTSWFPSQDNRPAVSIRPIDDDAAWLNQFLATDFSEKSRFDINSLFRFLEKSQNLFFVGGVTAAVALLGYWGYSDWIQNNKKKNIATGDLYS